MRGSSAGLNDDVAIAGNLVGPAALGADEIGRGGIVVQYVTGATISGNEVRSVGCLYAQAVGNASRVGIGLGDFGWPYPTATAVTNCTVTGNRIHGIVDEKTYPAAGLVVAGSGAPSANVVANNMVYGVRSNGSGGSGAAGIGICEGNGDLVVANSISMTDDLDPAGVASCTASCAGIRIASTTASNLTLKDNIIAVDVTSNTAALKHFSVVAPATSYAWGSGGANNNDYYANPANAQMVLGGIGTWTYAAVTTLAGWRTQFTPAQDGASMSVLPPFFSPTDLHLQTGTPTPLESGGTPISSVTTDYDGELRQATTPDVGADEGDFTPSTVNDVAAIAFVDPASGSTKAVGLPFSPQAVFQNIAAAAQTNVPVLFRILGPAPATTVVYSDWAVIASMPASGTPQTVAFASVTIATSGTYTVEARAQLAGDQYSANDRISGSFGASLPLAGVYQVGAAQPAPFNTLTSAINALNTAGVSSPVTFLLADAAYTSPAETFPIAINAFAGAGPSARFTIRPAPGITAAIVGTGTSATIKLNGADYVTIDGSNGRGTTRDLTISSTSNQGATAAVWLSSLGAGAGATNNAIRNCRLFCGADQSTGTAETFGVVCSGSQIKTSSDGANNNDNTIASNEITRARWGIYVRGASASLNENITILGNLIGPAAFGADQIGRGGIVVQYVTASTISDNEVRSIGRCPWALDGANCVGVGLGDCSSTGTTVTGTTVVRNIVHDVADEIGYTAAGIVLGGIGAPSGNIVANNMIFGIRAVGDAAGIAIAVGGGDKVVYNTISLSGDTDPSAGSTTRSEVGIRIASTAPSNLTLENNVIAVDVTSNTSALKHFAIVAPSTSYVWGSGGANNNDYHANPANPQMVLGGIGTTVPYSNVATLAAWRGQFTPAQDAASVCVPPPFISATDLHLRTDVPTQLESGGTPIAGVTVDYDSDPRHATTPDIGADEGTFTTPLANDVAATVFVDPTNGGAKIVGVPFSPKAIFLNTSAASQANVSVRFRIVGPTPATTVVYADSTFIASMPASSPPHIVAFASVTIVTGGTYTIEATARLDGDEVPSNDQITGSFSVPVPLAGLYEVGAGQPAPFGTLTSAINMLNAAGVSAAVTFMLTDTSYTSPAETFPITINAFAGASSTSTFTLKPGLSGVAITGSSGTAVIVLAGADHVILDGSANGGPSRDLTITNAGVGTSGAVVWGMTVSGPAAGVSNNVIKNLNVVGRGNVYTLFGIGMGGSTITTLSLGNGNNNNEIANNSITRTIYGIYAAGASAVNKNTGNVITQNVVNAMPPNNVAQGGITVLYEDGVRIIGNQIGEISYAWGSTGGILAGYRLPPTLSAGTSYEVTNATIAGNRVASIVAPGTAGWTAVGIAVAPATVGTNEVINNMISGVSSQPDQHDWTCGLYVVGGVGSTTHVYYNSTSMTGDRGTAATQPSFALAIGGAVSQVDLKDNISLNSQFTSGTGRSYAIGLGYSAYVSLTSDYNDFYATGSSSRCAIVGGLTNISAGERLTLTDWQTATGKDSHSLSADPLFTALTDLHINTGGSLSPVSNAGTPIAGVDADYDGDTRSVVPDIGADEFMVSPRPTISIGGDELEPTPAPERTFLGGNVPNPFGERTAISFGLHASDDVRLEIFDLSGRRVRTLKDGRLRGGYKLEVWDGRDSQGKLLPAGVYFVRLQADRRVMTRSVTIVR